MELSTDHATAIVELHELVVNAATVHEFIDGAAHAAARHATAGGRAVVRVHRPGRPAVASSSDSRATVQDAPGAGPGRTGGAGPAVGTITGDEPRPAPALLRDLGDGATLEVTLYPATPDESDMGRLARAQAFTDELTQATRVYLRWASGSPSAPDLRTALSEYTVLNQATGIVMARQRCSHEDALQVLRDTAARSGAPLHDAADTVVQEVTGATATPPAPFIPRRPPRTPAQHT